MDSDGEDDPNAIKQLLNLPDTDIIHVSRGKRKEGLFFRLSYTVYKVLFRLVTNKDMNFGNYCMINKKILSRINDTYFIHFAAYLSKQKATSQQIVFDRRKRIDGKSKMNLQGLIFHAFNSFVEYAEELLMIFLRLFVLLIFVFVASILFVAYIKLFTNDAIPGWASNLSIGFLNGAIMSIGFFVVGLFLLNISRNKIKESNKKLFEKVNK